jgi:hypothetical protein
MTYRFEPFTPEAFAEETGFDANDNEAIYLRWVNSQINYANYLAMKDMCLSLKEIQFLLKNSKQEEV